jgi:hypothetical protein
MAYIPSDLMTIERAKARRLKVETQSIVRGNAQRGVVFSGSTFRPGVDVSAGDVANYSVITTAEEWILINAIVFDMDFSAITDGKFSHTFTAYADNSNGNDWTHTPVNPLPAGRAINSFFVNDLPTTLIDGPVSATINSGIPDYNLFFENFFINTTGNRNTISSTGNSFFDNGILIIPPRSQMLFEGISSGGAAGTADIRTIFFFTELPDNEVGVST